MQDAAIEARYDVIVEERECPRPDGSTMALRIARPKARANERAVPRRDRHSRRRLGAARPPSQRLYRRHAGGRRHRRRGAGIPQAAGGRLSGLGRRQSSRDPLAQGECRRARQPAGSRRRDRHVERRASADALRAAARDDPRYGALALPGAETHDATLAFAVACWSVFDPLARYAMVRERGVKHLLAAHAAYWADEAAMAEGNPQLIVERGAFTQLAAAARHPGHQGRQPHRRHGGPLRCTPTARPAATRRLKKYDGKPHAFVILEPGTATSEDAIATMAGFIRARAMNA